jgi:hypothetical protein
MAAADKLVLVRGTLQLLESADRCIGVLLAAARAAASKL